MERRRSWGRNEREGGSGPEIRPGEMMSWERRERLEREEGR